MAFNQWIEGASPATGAVAVFRVFVTMLVAAGATVVADSDGTTYDSNGGQVTGGGSGTNGLGNTSAWICVELADGRQYVLQRGSANTAWRVKYSASAGFTGGSPGATRVPSATDEVTILGGGTDASPTYTTWFGTDAGYKLFGGADSVSSAFWFACVPNGGGAASAGFLHDPVNSASASDQDPVVVYIGITGGSVFGSGTLGSVSTATTTSRAAAWLDYNAGGSFVAMPGNGLASSGGGTIIPGAGGSNPHDGKDDLIPVVWWRGSAQAPPYGRKGVSSVVYWNPVTRSAGETFTVSTTRDRISFGDGNFPWSGSVVSL